MVNNGLASYKKTALHIALVAVLGFIVYSNTFNSPFSFDDDVFLRSETYKDISKIPSMFVEPSGMWSSRPLLHATMAINYYLDGLDTRGYHAVNLAFHIANGILLYLLVLLTGRQLGYREEVSRLTAVFASLLFMLHPLQTEAVTNIISRSILMATMFYISGIILFLKAANSERFRWLYGAGLFAVALLGAASREDFITFPLMLALYDLFFVARWRTKELLGRWNLYLPAVLGCGYLAYLATHHTYDTEYFFGKGIPPLHYALTQLNVHSTYLRLLLLPVNQNIDYHYPTAVTVLELPTMLSFLAYAGLWAVGVLLARRRPVAAFGMLWFLIALLPISFIVAALAASGFIEVSLGDVIFEHRAYLPSAGIVVLAAASLLSMRGNVIAGRIAVPLLVALTLLLGIATYARNAVWSDGITLWKDSITKSPGKARGYNNIATYYWKFDQKENALKNLRAALQIDPGIAEAHYNIGKILASEGLLDEAIGHYLESIRLEPNSPRAHFQLANTYMAKGLFSKAIEHYEQEIRISPTFAGVYVNLGLAYAGTGLFEKAIGHYEQTTRLRPDNAGAYINLGIAYKKAGMTDRAVENYEKALRMEPESADANYNLANAYMQQGRIDEAISRYEKSIMLRPDNPSAHNNLATAYRQKGLEEKAAEHIRIAETLRRESKAE